MSKNQDRSRERMDCSYSDRAAEVYEDAEYYVIDGAGHGFNSGAFGEAVRHIFDYLQEIGII